MDQDWVGILVNACRDFAARRRKLHLAQVPAVLRANGIDFKSLLNERKLSEVISAQGSGRLRIVEGDAKGDWFIEPAVDQDDSGMVTSSVNRDFSTTYTKPRYQRPFWTAFLKRIEEGKSRYVALDGAGFQDIPTGSTPPPNSSQLSPDELAEADLLNEESAEDTVHAAIRAWLGSRKLSADSFLLKSRVSSTARAPDAQHWLINLASLPEADLKRVSIPLDIILKALGKQ